LGNGLVYCVLPRWLLLLNSLQLLELEFLVDHLLTDSTLITLKFEHAVISAVGRFVLFGGFVFFLGLLLAFGGCEIFLEDLIAKFLLRFRGFCCVGGSAVKFDGLVEVAVDIEAHD
jgi:hypothetical protein